MPWAGTQSCGGQGGGRHIGEEAGAVRQDMPYARECGLPSGGSEGMFQF